ncbi:MAG: efflux RND transporter periplasmic adaptor subunit [Armatimonadetes bacterium]|nr:efflux RND transporter periplasmic adaptor subunit [Armatimonadota bacterium]
MRRWWWVFLIALIVVAAGAVLRGRGSPPAADQTAPVLIPVEVVAVEQGTVSHAVEVSGTVTAFRTAEIFPKVSGRVARVLVQDGARVAAGQALIELDPADQRTDLAQAEAAVASAEARLALLEGGLRPQERQVIQNAVTQAQNQVKAAETQAALAQAALRVAEDNLRRHEQLMRDGAIAQAQVDQARLQQDQARAAVQAAQAQTEIARAALDSARQQLTVAESGARSEELRAGRAQVEQARAVAAMARQRLGHMTLRAPFSGRVSGLTASVGDHLVSGDFAGRAGYAALVYDDQAMEVEVKIGEREIGLIKLGMRATLRLEGAPDQPAEATVRLVTPMADPVSRAASVRLRLKPGAAAAVPGTFARGEVVVEQRSGVLVVPKVAVSGGDQPVVRVVVDGAVQVRSVTLGLVQGGRVEVRTGVALGEQVIVLGPEVLAPGTRVRAVAR